MKLEKANMISAWGATLTVSLSLPFAIPVTFDLSPNYRKGELSH